MMVIEARAIRRLEAMDIPVWCSRTPKHAGTDVARPAATDSPESVPAAGRSVDASPIEPRGARIRLEAGSGRWLLVVDDADRARHATLIEDIRAALGTGDCRFGTWSDSPDAGVAVEDWGAHGIRHALVFGGDAGAGFVQGGDLARLTASGEARRMLWRQLQPLLAV